MSPSVDTTRNLIAVGSEDGSVYVWSRPNLRLKQAKTSFTSDEVDQAYD